MLKIKPLFIGVSLCVLNCVHTMGAGCWPNNPIQDSTLLGLSLIRALIYTAMGGYINHQPASNTPVAPAQTLTNFQQATPLMIETHEQEIIDPENGIVEPLHNVPADILRASPINRLFWAIENNNLAMVGNVIAQGVDIEKWVDDRTQATPLIRAAELGHEAIVIALIDAGANIEAQDIIGQTAYFKALRKNRTALMNLFEERGAITNIEILSDNASPKLNAYLDYLDNNYIRQLH